MKTLIIITGILIGLPNLSQAQVHTHSFGIRLNSYGLFYRPSLSYQWGLTNRDRINFNFNAKFVGSDLIKNKALRTSIYYEHVMHIKGGLNWFIGAGAEHSLNSNNGTLGASIFYQRLGIGPTIGLEYDFNQHKVPLLLSVDYRPSFGYFSGSYGTGFDFQQKIGLSLHYTFKDKKKEVIRNSPIE
jgi:hypothetical protein